MYTEDKYYGSFTVTGDQLRVSDPCYEHDSTGGVTLNRVKQGKWHASSVLVDREDGWGIRVASLRAVHEDYPDDFIPGLPYQSYKPPVAVDSGQAGIYDYKKYPDQEGQYKNDFYQKNCDLTLSEDYGGLVNDMGVVTSSGYGDGQYLLYYDTNNDQEVIAVEIIFISDEEADEDLEEDIG